MARVEIQCKNAIGSAPPRPELPCPAHRAVGLWMPHARFSARAFRDARLPVAHTCEGCRRLAASAQGWPGPSLPAAAGGLVKGCGGSPGSRDLLRAGQPPALLTPCSFSRLRRAPGGYAERFSRASDQKAPVHRELSFEPEGSPSGEGQFSLQIGTRLGRHRCERVAPPRTLPNPTMCHPLSAVAYSLQGPAPKSLTLSMTGRTPGTCSARTRPRRTCSATWGPRPSTLSP